MGKDEQREAKIEAQLREWAAELETLKAKADTAAAEVRKEYYEQVDELRQEMEATLRTWSKTSQASEGKAEGAEAAAKTLVERLHAAIQAQLRDLRPHASGVQQLGQPLSGGTRGAIRVLARRAGTPRLLEARSRTR
jgi:hypothetical protein